MKMKITGKTFATVNEVKEEFIVDLSKDNIVISNENINITLIDINEEMFVFETDSINYEIIQ